jgi:Tfp pilus assembly protein PilF
VVNEQVRSVDLLPTVLELLGVRTPAGLDGASVVGPIAGHPRPTVPPSYAETFYGKLHHGWSETYSLRVGEWKVIDAPKPELYDLRQDRREATNLVDRKPGIAGRLSTDLREMIGELGSGTVAQAGTPDRETVERLRSLGYVGALASPGRPGALGPDPKDMVGQAGSFDAMLNAATEAAREKRLDAAIVSLRRALVIDGRSYDAHLLLGNVYVQRRQFDAALGEYDLAALLHPTSIDPLIASAGVFAELGNPRVALERIRQAQALAPDSPEIPLNRGIVAERQGQLGEAFELYRKAVAANGSDPRAKARLAEAAAKLRRWDVAAPMFASLLEAGWQPSRAHFGLGQVAEARGDRATAAKEYQRALALDPGLDKARTALARVGPR